MIIACIDLIEPRSMIMTLVNGGAHLDFRTRKQGLTPLHRSAQFSRKEAILVSFIFLFGNEIIIKKPFVLSRHFLNLVHQPMFMMKII